MILVTSGVRHARDEGTLHNAFEFEDAGSRAYGPDEVFEINTRD